MIDKNDKSDAAYKIYHQTVDAQNTVIQRPAMKKKLMIRAMRATLGNVTAACRLVKCDRTHFYSILRDDPDFAEKIRQEVILANEEKIDIAEQKMMELVNEKDREMIRFLLRTIGKGRGYGESVENSNLNLNLEVKATTDEVQGILDRLIESNKTGY